MLRDMDISNFSKLISKQITHKKLSNVINKYETNWLRINNYHREFFWTNTDQSNFIESVILGIPINYIYVVGDANKENNSLEIIDGLQRIHTLSLYRKNMLLLNGLSTLTHLNNTIFNSLEGDRQRKLLDTDISIISVSDKIDLDTKIMLYNRLNNIN